MGLILSAANERSHRNSVAWGDVFSRSCLTPLVEYGAMDMAALEALEALDKWGGDELAEVIGQLHALEVATRATMLELVTAFEQSDAWRDDGATSVTGWLAYRLGLSHRTTAEWVRIASALIELPRVALAFAEGLLSWDQLRAVVAMATPETDAEWAERAPTLSAAALEAMARQAPGPHPGADGAGPRPPIPALALGPREPVATAVGPPGRRRWSGRRGCARPPR